MVKLERESNSKCLLAVFKTSNRVDTYGNSYGLAITKVVLPSHSSLH